MTTTAYKTPHEIELAGFEALVDKLGPGGAVQFMLQYARGQGDYTKERPRILAGITIEKMKKTLLSRK